MNDYKTLCVIAEWLEGELFEAEKVSDMEDYLMSFYGYDFSQLHKTLIREKYYQVRTL